MVSFFNLLSFYKQHTLFTNVVKSSPSVWSRTVRNPWVDVEGLFSLQSQGWSFILRNSLTHPSDMVPALPQSICKGKVFSLFSPAFDKNTLLQVYSNIRMIFCSRALALRQAQSIDLNLKNSSYAIKKKKRLSFHGFD